MELDWAIEAEPTADCDDADDDTASASADNLQGTSCSSPTLPRVASAPQLERGSQTSGRKPLLGFNILADISLSSPETNDDDDDGDDDSAAESLPPQLVDHGTISSQQSIAQQIVESCSVKPDQTHSVTSTSQHSKIRFQWHTGFESDDVASSTEDLVALAAKSRSSNSADAETRSRRRVPSLPFGQFVDIDAHASHIKLTATPTQANSRPHGRGRRQNKSSGRNRRAGDSKRDGSNVATLACTCAPELQKFDIRVPTALVSIDDAHGFVVHFRIDTLRTTTGMAKVSIRNCEGEVSHECRTHSLPAFHVCFVWP